MRRMLLRSVSHRARIVALACAVALVVPALAAPPVLAAGGRESPAKRELVFEKTRFVVDVGLAVGAPRQWVYKPYREGRFRSGADGRAKAFGKAGLATAFAVNRLNAAYKLTFKDDTLAKLRAPFDSLRRQVSSLSARVKGGSVGSGQLGDVNDSIDGLTGAAKDAGVDITTRTPPSAVVGG
jgi:hypothetical protein